MGACSFCAFKFPGRPLADYHAILEDQPEPARGESYIYRTPQMAVGKKAPELVRSETTLKDIFVRNVEQYPDKPFLGYRKLDRATGRPEKEITFMNWAEMDTICRELGSGVLNLNLAPEISEFRDYKMRFIALYAGNVPEWIHTDHAANCYGLTTIPMFDEMAWDSTIYIFRRTNVQTVFTTKKHLKEIAEMLKSGEDAFKCIKNIVILKGQEVFDLGDDTPDYKENLSYLQSETKLNIYSWDEVLDAGRKNFQLFADVTYKHVFTLYYTSGTTGEPKAAMLEVGALTTFFEQARVKDPSITDRMRHKFTYLQNSSFGHLPERLISWNVANSCSKYILNSCAESGYIYHEQLLDDLQLVKPFVIFCQPWFWNHLYHTINADIEKMGPWKKWWIQRAINYKLSFVEQGRCFHFFYDLFVLKNFRHYLGAGAVSGPLLLMTGAAPINPEIKSFFTAIMGRPMVEGCSQTEMCGMGFSQHPHDLKDPGLIGGIERAVEMKLIDVPELEYYVTHKDEEGRPAPRGEILYRGASLTPGYYKDEVQTAKAIDKDGWLHSGDIGMLLPERGHAMKLIDRKGHFLKLNNGKFVTPDRLEQSYKNCEGIKNVWIYGSSLQGFILAVCNVYEDKYLEIAKRVGLDFDGDFEKALGSDEAQKAFLENLQKNLQAGNKRIMDFEVAKGIIIEPENFLTLGMYTESGKCKRRALAARYQERLDALYKKLE